MSSPTLNLNQVTVSVRDIKSAINFYEKLGLTLIVEAEHYARFLVAGNNASFSLHVTDEETSKTCSGTVVYFETENLDEEVLHLKEKGLAFSHEPVMQSWLWYEAYLNDPSGNRICLYHAGRNRLDPPWRIKK